MMPELPEVADDPVELMLKRTGCIELHYKVQECIAETGDWRNCQDQVKEFKDCMKNYTDEQRKKYADVNVYGPRTKLALVVRADLKMSKGKTAAQCAHAAVLCYQQAHAGSAQQQELLAAWSSTGQPKIVLRVDAYEDISKLQKLAENAGIVATLVQDAGRTQLQSGTATVLGVGPDKVEEIDKLVAHLKLL